MRSRKMIPCLHDDIMTQILSRVPVEALYDKFRYVCKPWFNIITDPGFQHNHPVSTEPPCLIIQNMNYHATSVIKSLPIEELDRMVEPDPYTTSFIQLGEEGIPKQLDLAPVFFRRLWIRACCNGLMIVQPYGSPPNILYLVNHVTKQIVKLPPACYKYCYFKSFPGIGFTYIRSTGEYKVVLLRLASRDDDRLGCQRYIQILTFGGSGCYSSNYDDLQWRVVEAPTFPISPNPIAVDEVIYWGICLQERAVTCFDVSEEKFYTVPCPKLNINVGLLEMVGCLACWKLADNHQQLDFWILKNFRTGEWMKYTSMIFDQDFGRRIYEGRLYPVLSYGSNGEVMMFCDAEEGKLLAYNMKSSIRWKIGNNLRVSGDPIWFCGFHVNKILPLSSLLEKKQAA